MPAFTHKCSHFNISLAHNVITFYPVTPGDRNDLDAILLDMYHEEAFEHIGGKYQFVYNGQHDHLNYHDDPFYIKDWHSHVKFSFKLNEENLIKVFTQFTKYRLITSEDAHSFIHAYRKARRDSEELFVIALQNIELKINKLEHKAQEHPEAYTLPLDTAKRVYDTISEQFSRYREDKSLSSYLDFTSTCTQEIEKARESLKNYSGWKPASIEDASCSSSTNTPSFFKPNKKLNALQTAQECLLRI